MRNEILNQLENPKELEKLFRGDKAKFKREFNAIYEHIRGNKMAEAWHERLNYETGELNWGSRQELLFVIFASLIAGLIAKIPAMFNIDEEVFYPRNIAFIVFPVLSAYFIWRNKVPIKGIFVALICMLVSVVYINLLPGTIQNDTLFLACIHLPLFLWTVLGSVFVGDDLFNGQKRISYLRYNGDLIVMTTLIVIAGMILTGLTIGLFNMIGLNIQEFYGKYIIVFGAAASPLVGTYVTQRNPQLVDKVSPVIAKIFSPLVSITLAFYLLAIIYTGKDPYNDREFLLTFNLLLIGVMAIILFSVAETSRTETGNVSVVILFFLSLLTVIVNGIAISAIIFRISEWGITPNRMAVLGGNVLILINLLMVVYRLFKSLRNKEPLENVVQTIAGYLPIYSLWTMLVAFLFPLLFGFK